MLNAVSMLALFIVPPKESYQHNADCRARCKKNSLYGHATRLTTNYDKFVLYSHVEQRRRRRCRPTCCSWNHNKKRERKIKEMTRREKLARKIGPRSTAKIFLRFSHSEFEINIYCKKKLHRKIFQVLKNILFFAKKIQ